MNYFFRNKKKNHINCASFQIGILKAQVKQDIMKKLKRSKFSRAKKTQQVNLN